MKEPSEEDLHRRTIRETIAWFNGYAGREGAGELPSLYGLRRIETYLERRAEKSDDGYRELADMGRERVTFESLDRKMDEASVSTTPYVDHRNIDEIADAAKRSVEGISRSRRFRIKLKPAIPLTKTGKPDKRTVNALKRRAAAAKSAGKKVKGRK